MDIMLTVILKLAMGFGSLVGIAALVAVLINFLKLAGVVKDGTSGQWSAGLNLIAFVVLVLFAVFQPNLTFEILDGYAAQIAAILIFVLGYLTQIFTSSAVHEQFKFMRIPFLGTSFTDK